MIFDRLKSRYRSWSARLPKERLRRLIAALPDEAFSLEGLSYSRAELQELSDASEMEILFDTFGSILEEYEERKGRLPDDLWQELDEAAKQLGYAESLRPYWVDGRRAREQAGAATSRPSEGSSFHQMVFGGQFHQMKAAGHGPLEVGVAALKNRGGEADTVRLLRELFGLEFERAVAVLREAQTRVKDTNESGPSD